MAVFFNFTFPPLWVCFDCLFASSSRFNGLVICFVIFPGQTHSFLFSKYIQYDST